MPKSLPQTQPISSVANLLAYPPLCPRENAEAVYVKREFVLTASAAETLKRLVSMLESATRTTLSNSHVLRALLSLVAETWPQIEGEVAHLGPLARPSNARGKEGQRVAFEREIAAALLAGFRAGGHSGSRPNTE